MRVTSSWENFELSQPTVDVIEDATNDLGDRMESSSATEECEENIEDEMDDHGVDTLKHYPIIGAAVNIAEHADDIPVCASALPAPAAGSSLRRHAHCPACQSLRERREANDARLHASEQGDDPFSHLAAVEAMRNIMYSGIVFEYTKDELSQHVSLHLKDEGAYSDSCPDDWFYLNCLEISFTLDAVLKEDAIATNLPEEDEPFRTKLVSAVHSLRVGIDRRHRHCALSSSHVQNRSAQFLYEHITSALTERVVCVCADIQRANLCATKLQRRDERSQLGG
jgi:hypothetical protein